MVIVNSKKTALETVILLILLVNSNALWETYEAGLIDIYNGEEKKANDIVLALNLPYTLCPQCYDKRSGSGYNTGKYYAAAASLAIEDINNNTNLLGNYTLRYVWHNNKTDTHCNEIDAIKITMEQLNLGVDGFLGFTCRCMTVAKMISAVNLPLFSGVRIFPLHCS